MLKDDPIVTEVRKARREILVSYQDDYRAMLRGMMKKQWESGHEVLNPGLNGPSKPQSQAFARA